MGLAPRIVPASVIEGFASSSVSMVMSAAVPEVAPATASTRAPTTASTRARAAVPSTATLDSKQQKLRNILYGHSSSIESHKGLIATVQLAQKLSPSDLKRQVAEGNLHFDWWAFPINAKSSRGDVYTPTDHDIEYINNDLTFKKNYHDMIGLYFKSMGWDIVEGKAIDGQDLPKDLYAIRFAKCLKSMQCFGEADLYNNALKFLQASKTIDKISGVKGYIASSLLGYEQAVIYAKGDNLYTKKADGEIDGFSIFKANQHKFRSVLGNNFVGPSPVTASIILLPESSLAPVPLSIHSIPSALSTPSISMVITMEPAPSSAPSSPSISIEVLRSSVPSSPLVPPVIISSSVPAPASKIAPPIFTIRTTISSQRSSPVDDLPATKISKPIVYNPVYRKYINTPALLKGYEETVTTVEGVNSARTIVSTNFVSLKLFKSIFLINPTPQTSQKTCGLSALN